MNSQSIYHDIQKHMRIGFCLLLALLSLVLVWGGVAQISGAVLAFGRVVFETKLQRIQHREGGIIKEILVHDGERVQANQVLLRLDKAVVEADLGDIKKQLWHLQARKMRLEAERDGQTKLTISGSSSRTQEMMRALLAEQNLLDLRKEIKTQRKIQMQEQITQALHDLEEFSFQKASLERQISLLNREQSTLRYLYEKKQATFTQLSQIERAFEQLNVQKSQLDGSFARAKMQIAQTRIAIKQVDLEALNSVMEDLKEAEIKVTDLEKQRSITEETLRRLEVRSPVRGKVQQMSVHTQGGVVTPGETLMFIAPEADQLVIEAPIDPKEINNVRIGSQTYIKFTSFNAATTPEIHGRIDRLSSDIEVDEKTGLGAYRAAITFNENAVPPNLRDKLLAGMPAEIQIQTGSRSALSYFLKPLADQLAKTFKEN